MKASIMFFLNEDKANQKTGKILVCMRICFKRAKTETRLKLELIPLDLIKWDSITLRLTERNSPVNHHLNRLDQKFHEFITLNATDLPKDSAALIRYAPYTVSC